MRSVGAKILLAVNRTQKTDFELELGDSGVRIWMTHGGFDQKIVGATLAEVIADGHGFSKGELVLTHHNAFGRDIDGDMQNFLGDTGLKTDDGRKIFAIELPMVFLRVDENGNAKSTDKYLIATRIKKPPPVSASSLIVAPDSVLNKYYEDRFVITDSQTEGLSKGKVVYTDKYGGLPVRYVFNKKEIEVIRIDVDDILAIDEA